MEETRLCKKCGEEKLLSEFHDTKRQHRFTCRLCQNKYAREWDKNNPDKAHNRMLRWKLNGYIKKTYGISSEDYNHIFANQNGKCAICGRHQNELNKRLYIDHNHDSGIVRGLLCHRCNLMIGHASDDPEILRLAADYLEKH